MEQNGRSARIATAVAVVAGLLLAFAAVGGINAQAGGDPASSSYGQYGQYGEYGQYTQMVHICHEGRTMHVPRGILAGHLAHGDTLGRCKKPKH